MLPLDQFAVGFVIDPHAGENGDRLLWGDACKAVSEPIQENAGRRGEARMKTLSGVFVNLESAERVCRQLEGSGIAQSQLSLTFDDDCPACAYERDALSPGSCESLPIGQGLGALLGIALGVAAVFWPLDAVPGAERAASDPVTFSLFDWMLRLFIIACWSLSGAILGGMLAATVAEAWGILGRRSAEKPLHSHYILTVESPAALDEQVRTIIQRRGGRLVETSAVSRAPKTSHS